jgi:endoglucanase
MLFLSIGNTDCRRVLIPGAIQRQGAKGSIAGAISIPLRHVHQSIEMAHEGDINSSVDLLVATLTELDQWNWEL